MRVVAFLSTLLVSSFVCAQAPIVDSANVARDVVDISASKQLKVAKYPDSGGTCPATSNGPGQNYLAHTYTENQFKAAFLGGAKLGAQGKQIGERKYSKLVEYSATDRDQANTLTSLPTGRNSPLTAAETRWSSLSRRMARSTMAAQLPTCLTASSSNTKRPRPSSLSNSAVSSVMDQAPCSWGVQRNRQKCLAGWTSKRFTLIADGLATCAPIDASSI